MNADDKSPLLIFIENGAVVRVASADASALGRRCIEIHDGEPRRTHTVDYTDESQITAAVVAMREEQQRYGLGLACEVAADALRDLSATAFGSAREMLARIEGVMAAFARQVHAVGA